MADVTSILDTDAALNIVNTTVGYRADSTGEQARNRLAALEWLSLNRPSSTTTSQQAYTRYQFEFAVSSVEARIKEVQDWLSANNLVSGTETASQIVAQAIPRSCAYGGCYRTGGW